MTIEQYCEVQVILSHAEKYCRGQFESNFNVSELDAADILAYWRHAILRDFINETYQYRFKEYNKTRPDEFSGLQDFKDKLTV